MGYLTDTGQRQSNAKLERSVPEVKHRFGELFKIALYLYLSPSLMFLAFGEHKADLVSFLLRAPANNNIIVGGRFEEEDTIKCFCPNVDI